MITTLIFDLDGLLADTEKLHCSAYQDALARYGFELTEQDYSEHWILKGGSIGEFIDRVQSPIQVVQPFMHERFIDRFPCNRNRVAGSVVVLDV